MSHDCTNLGPLEHLISASDTKFESTRSLDILPQHTSPELSIPHLNSDPRRDGDGVFDPETPLGQVNQPKDDNLNLIIRVLLGKIPRNNLRSFRYV